ncbi:MAG: NAD-dependent epimerase/dehydratase family protein [Saprospiraceae bacterium]
MKILVTGSAGFIGFHLANRLIEAGYEVVGLDSINDYYQVGLKYDRLKAAGIEQRDLGYNRLQQSALHSNYRFIKLRLEDESNLFKLFAQEQFEIVVHLAAQAGVRYSIDNPKAYISSNIVGFANLLEAVRHYPIQHLVFASSSSVYGLNKEVPFSVNHKTDRPVSLYGATKKSNELMAHAYSHLFNTPMTGLRFFTVYGPWGRPDMAYFLFTEAILKDQPIKVFNEGKLSRDFTFVDDVVEGVMRILQQGFKLKTLDNAPFNIYNIGKTQPIRLLKFIATIEEVLGKTTDKQLLPMQQGDVLETWADADALVEDYDYQPQTDLRTGIERFVDWYREYYNLSELSLRN